MGKRRMQTTDAVKVLNRNRIPFCESDSAGVQALLSKSEVDPSELRRLGFRISRTIGDQLVVVYKGRRIGFIV